VAAYLGVIWSLQEFYADIFPRMSPHMGRGGVGILPGSTDSQYTRADCRDVGILLGKLRHLRRKGGMSPS
jgi:hypothetical protein